MDGVELQLAQLLTNLGIEKENLGSIQKLVIIIFLIVVAFLGDYLCRRIVVPIIKKITLRTQVKWDDYLFNDNFLNNCCHIIPPVFLSFSLPLVFDDSSDSFIIIQKLLIIYVIIISVRIICSFLTSLYSITSEYEKLKSHPLKGVYQMLKIVVISVGIIIVVANLLNKSPMSVLTGLGASAAILMLIFKDSIMGLVAGIQLSANKMLTPGDWISMPKYGADGIVMEVTLTTVKVRNWDNTIITVPPYALVSDSFQNWRGMQQSDGRRVKCSVNVDMKTVRFCNPTEIEYFKRKGWISSKAEVNDDITNLSVFRRYMEKYLYDNVNVNNNMTIMVRQLQSSSEGLPVELYFFTTDKEWVTYEKIKSDIIGYFISVMPQFGLKVFQRPSGEDIIFMARDKMSLQ